MSKDEGQSWVRSDESEGADNIPLALLSEPQTLELSDRDMDALLEAIANPPPPNEAMLRSIARSRELGSPMVDDVNGDTVP